jgi:DNA-binding Lrp family transcriptional regulator
MVLFKVERSLINEVAEELCQIEGVSEVYSVAGQYDLVGIIRVSNNDELAKVVTSRMLKIEGITSSETLIAFRVYSRYDLERMFSIGVE